MSLPPASRARALSRRPPARHGSHSFLVGATSCDRFFKFPGLCFLGGGRVPVVHDLAEEDGVEGETRNEAVQDEGIVDFLEGGEDAREGAKEVIDDLRQTIISKCSSEVHGSARKGANEKCILTAKALNCPVPP